MWEEINNNYQGCYYDKWSGFCMKTIEETKDYVIFKEWYDVYGEDNAHCSKYRIIKGKNINLIYKNLAKKEQARHRKALKDAGFSRYGNIRNMLFAYAGSQKA